MTVLQRLLIIFVFSSFFASANEGITLSDDNLGTSFGEQVSYFIDKEVNYQTIGSIREIEDTAFTESDLAIPDFNFTNGNYWLKFKIRNRSSFENFILETGRPVTNKVDFYAFSGGKLVSEYKSGDDYSYKVKEISHRKHLFPLKLKGDDELEIYIRLKSDGELLFAPIFIYDRMSFFAKDFKDQFKNGFYFGLIALVVIIYLFFFLFLKDRAFLFYILYAFSQGMLQFSLDGYTHHHFFPAGGYFTNHVLLVFAGLTVIFLLTYVDHFLNLKENNKRLQKIFLFSRIILGIIAVMSLIPGPLYEISYPIINGASLFSVLLAAFAIIFMRVKGVRVDPFFALAFIVLIIGGVVFILGNLSVVGDKVISLGALKISSALEFVILSISMSNKYGKLQREKEEAQRLALKNLQEKNAVMDASNLRLEDQVKERTKEIERQKDQLSRNNKEIVSSIQYAKRIQEAILPSNQHVKHLLEDFFILYKPKDVVSGDFYFVESTKASSEEDQSQYTIFSAVDCTGHGVPGALMSVIGNNLLTQSLTEPHVNTPAEALDYLHDGVNKALRRTQDEQSIRDGMDIAFCALNRAEKKLFFSGSKNPLYLLRAKNVEGMELPEAATVLDENEAFTLYQIKGDRQSIGSEWGDEAMKYTNHEISLVEGDVIYIFSDGYADQFGGIKGKKYNYRRFRSFLLEIGNQKMVDQKKELHAELERYRGDLEQIDDILVMGVRI